MSGIPSKPSYHGHCWVFLYELLLNYVYEHYCLLIIAYELKKEKQTCERIKKKAGKMYALLLFLLVIGINIIFYYFRNQSI
jgi:hypothetical protein